MLEGFWMEKPKGRRTLGKTRSKCGNIMILIMLEEAYWTHLAHLSDKLRVLLNTVVNIWAV